MRLKELSIYEPSIASATEQVFRNIPEAARLCESAHAGRVVSLTYRDFEPHCDIIYTPYSKASKIE